MRRVLTASALGIAIAVVTASCASPDQGTTPNASGSASSAGTGASQPVPAESVATLKQPDVVALGEQMTGAVRQAKTVHATITTEGAGTGINGETAMKLDPADFGMDVTMHIPAQQKVPAGQSQNGKPWVKISATGTDLVSKAMAPLFAQLRQTADPGQASRLLASSSTVKQMGTEQVDGVQATRYQVTVDLAKLIAAADATQRAALNQLSKAGLKTLEYQFWLDDKRLPLRMTNEVTIPQQGTLRTEVRYRDWGAPVTITEPPADQVGPLPTTGR
jgi:hypothetical protein